MKKGLIMPNLLKLLTKVYLFDYFSKYLGIFDAILIETKGSVSQAISESVLRFLAEQHDWSKIIEALTGQKVSQASKEAAAETTKSSPAKSTSDSKAGHKTISTVKPFTNLTKKVEKVIFSIF